MEPTLEFLTTGKTRREVHRCHSAWNKGSDSISLHVKADVA